MPIFFDPLPPGAHDGLDPCRAFGKPKNPITRVIRTLKLIRTAFDTADANVKKNIDVVIKAITVMHGTRTESYVCSLIVGTDLHNVVRISLSAKQCDFVLGLFGMNVMDGSVLEVTDKWLLEPVLLLVLCVGGALGDGWGGEVL